MSSKRKVIKSCGFGAGVAIGTALSVILSVILAMITAVLIMKEQIGENTIEYITLIIALISSLTGCFTAGRLTGEKIAIVIGTTGIIYLLILIGSGILFFNGGFHNLWRSVLSITLGCTFSCAICIRGQGSRTKRKRSFR